jgi:hypothetical protein
MEWIDIRTAERGGVEPTMIFGLWLVLVGAVALVVRKFSASTNARIVSRAFPRRNAKRFERFQLIQGAIFGLTLLVAGLALIIFSMVGGRLPGT